MTKQEKRELFVSLAFAGSSPEGAILYNNKFSLDDYLKASKSKDYKKFTDVLNKEFIEGADLRLLGNLYRAEEALLTIGASDKNYPTILKAYTELLKLTSPIVERLQKQKLEIARFDGLELVIEENSIPANPSNE